MSNAQAQTDNQIKQDISNIASQANDYIAQLNVLKAGFKANISDVEVTYSADNRPDLSKAVKEIFGDETSSVTDPGSKAITLDMYLTCLQVIKEAGKFKANDFLVDKVLLP